MGTGNAVPETFITSSNFYRHNAVSYAICIGRYVAVYRNLQILAQDLL